MLAHVRHRSTGEAADMPAGAAVSKAYRLGDNFSDRTAHLQLPSLPPLFPHSLFDKSARKGPHAVFGFSGRPKDFAKMADDTVAAWESDALAAKGKASSVAWEELAAHPTFVQQTAMAKARQEAKTALAKARRSIAIT